MIFSYCDAIWGLSYILKEYTLALLSTIIQKIMADFCDHFQNLKPEKIANFIKKSKFKCSNTKHIDH